jgi:hypothetical protein
VKARKARIREKEKRRIAVVFLSFFILLVAGLLFLAYRNPSGNSPSAARAAIVDQLSFELYANKTFVDTATSILNQSGYVVDYYPGETVTVSLYRNLLAYGYKIIILRVHCGIAANLSELGFFTSQPYSQPSIFDPLYGDVMYDRVGYATIHDPPNPGETAYFAIRAGFVRQYGKFSNATIIVMGCYGMKYTSMAQAFVQKGARVYIGWEGLKDADHSDEATATLLRHLTLDNQTIGQAVQNTKNEVGEDPSYTSPLDFYPSTSPADKQ